jgi:SIT4-associating protein SAP155
LQRAINETISFTESDTSLHEVTNGLDDVSLDDITIDGTTNGPSNTLDKLIEAIDNENDSDDEEPSISPENPFVCEERDQTIRLSPCVGDYFKIRLVDLGILLNIVRKFTKFPWHNFFHNVVFDLIQQIFNGKLNSYNSFLIVDLFNPSKSNLTDLIVKLYKSASDPRPGYMGHLILISEEVVKFTSLYKPDIISPVIVDAIQSDDWEWFVRDILLKTRQVYNVVLGADQEAADQEHESEYAYDSSTVGYLDLDNYDGNSEKHVIILGDTSNHNAFVNDNNQDDENMEENICDVEVQKMTPTGNVMTTNDDSIEDGDHDHYEANSNTDAIDTLSGSSSSDEEINDEEINDDDSNEDEDTTHELRRVPKHHEK